NFSEPFKTEIGPVSVPTLETIRAMMPPQDWETINDDWASHDMVRGAQAGDRYPTIIAQRYGAMTNLADFTRKAQMANYEAHRALFEGRLAKMFNPVTGVIMWMSNPSQPSFVWQIYSHDLDTHSSFYAVKKACEPIHIMMNQTTSHLMLINNTAAALSGAKATVSVYNLDGTRKSTNTVAVAGTATAATDLGDLLFPEDLSPVHFVKLELRDAKGALVSDNFYWRETTPDNFQALNTLPRVALDAKTSHRKQNGQMTTTVTLRNTSTVPALMTHLQMRTGRTNRRVLPAFYSDNYVSLLPGESKTIEIEAAEAAFGGETPLVMVDGWNVSVKPGAGVAPNVDAISVSTTFPVAASAGGTPISQIK
ncbi:MAG TPA: glycoside hydrolase family 2 protein, partial [Abditibacterium sp.]